MSQIKYMNENLYGMIDKYGDDYINYSKKVNRFIPKVI